MLEVGHFGVAGGWEMGGRRGGGGVEVEVEERCIYDVFRRFGWL